MPRKVVTRDALQAQQVREERMSSRATREANREQAVETARLAAERRIGRMSTSLVERVDMFKKRVEHMPPASVLQLFQQQNMPEREALLLALEDSDAPKELLRRFTPVRRATREKYLQEVGKAETLPDPRPEPEAPSPRPKAKQTRPKGYVSTTGKKVGDVTQEA